MPRKRLGWSALLARPISVKDGPMLRTLHDVHAFVLGEPKSIQERRAWRRAYELLLAAAEHGGDIEAVTSQVEAALFLEAKWVPPR
jgi:hypothetical protein